MRQMRPTITLRTRAGYILYVVITVQLVLFLLATLNAGYQFM